MFNQAVGGELCRVQEKMTQKRAVDRPMLLMAAVRMIEYSKKVGNDVNFNIVYGF